VNSRDKIDEGSEAKFQSQGKDRGAIFLRCDLAEDGSNVLQ